MGSLTELGKFLIFCGLVLLLLGLIFTLAGKIPHLGKLPGDLIIHKKGLDIYFPLATCLIVSLILSVILSLIFRKN